MLRRNAGDQRYLFAAGALVDELGLKNGHVAHGRIDGVMEQPAAGLVLVMPPKRLHRETGHAGRKAPDVAEVLPVVGALALLRVWRLVGVQDVGIVVPSIANTFRASHRARGRYSPIKRS